jgi:branched-chain amino acid transport system ATP-binding protein
MDLLSVRGVTKYFGGLTALKDVTLSLSSGRIKSIIGPNGAGKTTLFNLISGNYAPDAGEIFLGGRKISGEMPEKIARSGVARTFQVGRPFRNLTALENVLIGTLNRTNKVRLARDEAAEMLNYIGMAEKAEWPAKKLTLEDLKRLELGRALAIRPRLLLLDEVMAGLNPTETEEFIGLIRKIRKDGVTILLIEHVMQAVLSLSDEVFVLNYGEKIYEGDTEGVMKDPKVIEAYLGEESFWA